MTENRVPMNRATVVMALGLIVVPTASYYLPVLPEVFAVLTACVFLWLEPAPPIVSLGLNRPKSIGRALLIGVVVGLGLFLLNRLLLLPWLDYFTGTRRDLSKLDYLRGNVPGLLVLLPTIWITAGFCEEVIYRAYAITRFDRLFGSSAISAAAAIVLSATVFALAHWYQGVVGMLVTGFAGLALGILFVARSRNLWSNICAHIVVDTVSLIAIGLNWDRPLDAFGRSLFGL